MSNRIAIIDLDGVVADSTARFAKAEEAKAAWLAQHREQYADTIVTEKRATELYWQTALSPEWVHLDTLIDGVPQAIEQIETDCGYYPVIFLTSRPETMREATEEWLFQHGLYGASDDHKLLMKPTSQQFVKTTTWKAGVVQMLASLYDAKTILVIDDEVANHEELSKHASSLWMVYLAKSLQEAVSLISK